VVGLEVMMLEVEAYASGGGGLLWGLINAPVAIASGALGMVMGAAGTVGGAFSSAIGLGVANTAETAAGSDQENAGGRPDQMATTRFRTIGQMRTDAERDPQQLYNGNQLNFQADDEGEE